MACVSPVKGSGVSQPCSNHTPIKKRAEFKSRVNHYLYDNLNRVLCELYFLIELQSNPMQCAEVLTILSKASLQFAQLHHQLMILSNTNPANTKSVSWNVSSISPQLSPQKLDFFQLGIKPEKATAAPHSHNQSNANAKPKSSSNASRARAKIIDDDCKEVFPLQTPEPTVLTELTDPTEHKSKLTDSSRTAENGTTTSTIEIDRETKRKSKATVKAKAKPKKAIKCWADYDSDSDLDIASTVCDTPSEAEAVSTACADDEDSKQHQPPQLKIVEDVKPETKEAVVGVEKEKESEQEAAAKEDWEFVGNDSERHENDYEQYIACDVEISRQSKANASPPIEIEKPTESAEQMKQAPPIEIEKENVPQEPKTKRSTTSAHSAQSNAKSNHSNHFEKIEIAMAERDAQSTKSDPISPPIGEIQVNDDAWFASGAEPVALRDIINHQSQPDPNHNDKENVQPNGIDNVSTVPTQQTQMQTQTPTRVTSWNAIVGSKPRPKCIKSLYIDTPRPVKVRNRNEAQKIDAIIHRLSSDTRHYQRTEASEQKRRMHEKQQRAEKRRMQLRAQRNSKWRVVAANKKQKRDALRRQTESRLAAQKQELAGKMRAAQQRHEQKLLDKARKAKEYDAKIRHAAKEKDSEERKKREQQRKSHEQRMRRADERYKRKLSTKKQLVTAQNSKASHKSAQLNSIAEKKKQSIAEKHAQKLRESELRRQEILKQMQQKSTDNEQKKLKVLQRKRQIEKKKKQIARKKQIEEKKAQQQKRKKAARLKRNSSSGNLSDSYRTLPKLSSVDSARSAVSSGVASSVTSETPSMAPSPRSPSSPTLDTTSMRKTLTRLLQTSAEYLDGIKPRREWLAHGPLSELKSSIQALCAKTYKLHVHRIQHEEAILAAMLGDDERAIDAEDVMRDIESKWLEAQLQCILKRMDGRHVEDASHTYLLMYLVDDLVGFTPFVDKLSARAQRMLLQCIVNATQKNRGVAHYVIRSSCCLYLSHLLQRLVGHSQSVTAEVGELAHALTIAVNSIRDFPDLTRRKVQFYKHLTSLALFAQMSALFERLASDERQSLLLRIVPFFQAVTAFDTAQCPALQSEYAEERTQIMESVKRTQLYGLHSLVSTLVLPKTNSNSKTERNSKKAQLSWKKKKAVSVLRIVLHAFQSLNNLARMDLKALQRVVNRRGVQTQLIRVLCFLLQHLTFHFKANAKAKLGIKDKTDIYNNSYCITRVLLGQVVLFVGYCARGNAKFQKCLSWSVDGQNSLIAKLCQLPFDYFSKPQQTKVLFPTLICCTFGSRINCDALGATLSTQHLTYFILRTYHAKHNAEKAKVVTNDMTQLTAVKAYELEQRFPLKLWPKAIQFYKEL